MTDEKDKTQRQVIGPFMLPPNADKVSIVRGRNGSHRAVVDGKHIDAAPIAVMGDSIITDFAGNPIQPKTPEKPNVKWVVK